MDNKTSSVCSLVSATPMPNYESRELSNASNMDDFKLLWAEFPDITQPSLSNVGTMIAPLHIITEGSPD